MGKILLAILFILQNHIVMAQNYDQDRILLVKFIERMYASAPFEGCRIIDDYDNSYLLSVVLLDRAKYKNEMIMNRVAEVKAQRNAGEFLNGTQSFSEFTIKTPKCEINTGDSNMVETYEIIKTNSIGYIKMLQLFASFLDENNNTVFVFARKITNK